MTFEPVHWTEWLRALGPAIIAGVVAYIAYRQWRLAQATLREKLFERRLAIYSEVHVILSEFIQIGDAKKDIVRRLQAAWRESRFLFSSEVSECIQSITNAVIMVRYHQNSIHDGQEPSERKKHIDGEHERMIWLSGQFEPVFKTFEPYLKFDRSH